MEKEIRQKYKTAGKIAARALAFAKSLTKPGALIVDIAEAVEAKIIELGGQPAFPINISINEVAAHYSPQLYDKRAILATDHVKLDVGVHVDGYIGDTAATVCIAEGNDLIACAEQMLKVALPMFTPGTVIADIGAAIEATAVEFGLKSVRNLTGHELGRFDLHAGIIIPNIKTTAPKVLNDGEVYAVEPFCTAGAGWVKEARPSLIFRWLADKPLRMREARTVLGFAKTRWNRLPFAKRWIQREFRWIPAKLDHVLSTLIATNCIYAYPILREKELKPVAQAEHTVIVAERPIITTKI
jgi:methionyl aminopeptidase